MGGIGGALRPQGLEAPFVGRDRELRLVKEMFHASADEGKARLVSITGIAGIGKSRLAWEFYKYIDGLADTVLWHRGRCLAYGQGVAYWALSQMVKSRAEISEDDEPTTARAKLASTLAGYFPAEDERRWGGAAPGPVDRRRRAADARAGQPVRGLAPVLRTAQRA